MDDCTPGAITRDVMPKPSQPGATLRTVEETQRLMRWPAARVRDLVASGEIRSVRQDGRQFIDVASLHA